MECEYGRERLFEKYKIIQMGLRVAIGHTKTILYGFMVLWMPESSS